MPKDASAVNIGVGAIYKAPSGTTLPTDLSALSAAYVDLGWISEDGVEHDPDESTEKIRAWDGTTIRTVLTETTAQFQFTMMQTDAQVLQTYFRGSTITEPAAGVFRLGVKTPNPDRAVWVIDLVDGADEIRIVLPDAEIAERGTVNFKNGEAISYPVTVYAYPFGVDQESAIWLSNNTAWSLS